MVLAESAMTIGAPVPVAQYARPGTAEVAEVTFNAMLPDKLAAVMAHHGLVTVGRNLESAYQTTVAVETTARLVITAYSMGKTVKSLDPSECQQLRNIYLSLYKPQAAKQ